MNKLPIRPVGTYTIQWYGENLDCLAREYWDRGMLEAGEYAKTKSKELIDSGIPVASFSVDRRVISSAHDSWSPKRICTCNKE